MRLTSPELPPQPPRPESPPTATQAKRTRLRYWGIGLGVLAGATLVSLLSTSGVQADIPPRHPAHNRHPVLDTAGAIHEIRKEARQEIRQELRQAIKGGDKAEPVGSNAAAGASPNAGGPSEAAGSSEAAPSGETPSAAEGSSTGAPWPTHGWAQRTLAEAGINPTEFQRGVDYAFESTGNEENREGVRTDGLVVIHKGYLVFEQYARGYTPTMRHMTWSVSKSLTSAMVGVAVGEHLLKVDDPVARYYPAMDHAPHNTITIAQLLHMSSGLAWAEGYEASPLKSSVIAMLYTSGRQDMAAYTAQQPLAHPPDTFWQYSSGSTNLAAAVVRTVVGDGAYATWPWDKLFTPLGMGSSVLERDQAGTFVGSSYWHATPQDMARFGYLYLNDGKWDGQQILPEGWVKWSSELATALKTTPANILEGDDRYGAMWWLNQDLSPQALRPWLDVPQDAIAARGHWGQYIIVIPSRQLVVVRTGDDRDGSFDANRLLKPMLASLPTE